MSFYSVLANRALILSRAASRASIVTNIDLAAGAGITQFSAAVATSTTPYAIAPIIDFLGGIVGLQNAAGLSNTYSDSLFDGDIILQGVTGATPYVINTALGAVFIDASQVLVGDGRISMRLSGLVSGAAERLWGTGTYDSIGKTIYPTGAGSAASTFKSGVTLQENLATVGCVGNSANALGIVICNSAVTTTNLKHSTWHNHSILVACSILAEVEPSVTKVCTEARSRTTHYRGMLFVAYDPIRRRWNFEAE